MGAARISSLHPFMNSEVIVNISNAVVVTLKTRAQVSGLFEKSYVERNWKAPSEVSVLMNEEITSDSAQIIDCIGELSNICHS